MAFPEGNEDNISQRMGSTVHDDDFQEALNMISEDIDDKAKLAQVKDLNFCSNYYFYFFTLIQADEGQVYINMR